MGVGIILTSLMMLVLRPRRRQFLQPLANVFDQSVLEIVDVNGSGDVHWRDKAQSILNSTPAYNLFHLVSDVNHFFVLLSFKNKIFGMAFHISGCSSFFRCSELLPISQTIGLTRELNRGMNQPCHAVKSPDK